MGYQKYGIDSDVLSSYAEDIKKEEDKTKTIQELDREKLEEKFSNQVKEKLN